MAREFDQSIADRICFAISSGETIRTICKELEISSKTVYSWIVSSEDFGKQYARAKEHQAEVLADEILSIADEVEFDSESGNAAVQAARLRVDSRKWLLSKLLPKKYGDRIENRLSDPNGEALKIIVTGIRPTEDNT